jgi:trimeric autotransporter adhesin
VIGSTGSVGIGTATPFYPLDINANVIAVGTTVAKPGFGGALRFRDDTGTPRWLFGLLGSSGATTFNVSDMINHYQPFIVQAGAPTNSFVLTPNGVGIGTTNPAQKLEVAGNLRISGAGHGIIFPDGTTQTSAATGGGGGTAGVTSFNTRTGAVVSATNDYAFSQISGSVGATQLSGTYSNALTLSNASNSFTGNGAGLTNVNAATLNGLNSSAFVSTSTSNNFTADQTISANLNVTGDMTLTGTLNGWTIVPSTGSQCSIFGSLTTCLSADILGGYTGKTGALMRSADGKIVRTTVTGGNTIDAGVVGATISGGGGTVGGTSYADRVSNHWGTVGGGANNQAGDSTGPSSTNCCQFVGGGYSNIANGHVATIGGGFGNSATGTAAAVPGGSNNTASGDNSFAAGRRARAVNNGAFVWGDATDADVSSTANNQFIVRATGGVQFFTDTGLTKGLSIAASTGNVAITGSVTAASFVGDGSGLTNVTSTSGVTSFKGRTGAVVPASGDYSFSQISGSVGATQLSGTYSNALTLSNASNSFTGSFTGNGSGLTNVNAASLGGVAASGFATLGANTFTGTQTISSGNLALPATNGSGTSGVITLGGAPFAYSYGSGNTFLGASAGNFTMIGFSNTASGTAALRSNTTGEANTADGVNSLNQNTVGEFNTASGVAALYSNTTGSDNTASGYGALNTNQSGGGNTGIGDRALYGNCTGFASGCPGNNNTGLGYQAGQTTASANANLTGANNTYLGAYSGPASSTQFNNSTAIGANAVVGASNALVLGSINGVNGAAASVKVGIGTATPAYTLDVVGTGNFSGAVTANSFTGDGSGLTNVAASTSATATTASGLSCTGCVGNTQLGVNYAASSSKGGDATNALALGGVAASDYATLGANSFTGDQTVTGNISASGTYNSSLVLTPSVSGSDGIFTYTTANVIAGYAAGSVTTGANTVTAGVVGATIAGGGGTTTTSADLKNSVTDDFGTVGGGNRNVAGNASGTTYDAFYATVGGGSNNTANGSYGTIAGGHLNIAGAYAVVSGGNTNTASGNEAAVLGGSSNIASGNFSVVAGGSNNNATATYSFAAGCLANSANAGAFVWSGYSSTCTTTLTSSAVGQFVVNAPGGFWLGNSTASSVTATMTAGHFLDTTTTAYLTTSGTWTNASDRNLKTAFEPLDESGLLALVGRLPITSWRYKVDPDSIRHMGPMAQDFYAAFKLGNDNKHISTVDEGGVALAGVQALYRLSMKKDAEIRALAEQNRKLTKEVDRLKKQADTMAALEARLDRVEAQQKAARSKLARVAHRKKKHANSELARVQF